MTAHPHFGWLVDVADYLGEVAAFLIDRLEPPTMSTEADAAKQELAALKGDLEALTADLQTAHASYTAAADDAAADKQALVDLQAEASALRQQIAAIRASAP